MLRQAMTVEEVPVVRPFLIRVAFLIWGILIGMWIVTPETSVNDLLDVGFVLIDPDGHEVARFDD